MFKNEGGGGVIGRLNNVQKTDDLVREGVPKLQSLINQIFMKQVLRATNIIFISDKIQSKKTSLCFGLL